MSYDFCYYNPVKIYFGEEQLVNLPIEIEKYGENLLLVYGGGSVKRTGIYREIMQYL